MGRHASKFKLSALVLAGLLAGCPSHTVLEAPAPRLEAMPYAAAEGAVQLGADPYVQPGRVKAVFGEDLAAAEVIPVQVVVRNGGEGLVRVEEKNFKLSLPGDEVVAPRAGSEVAALFGSGLGAWSHASTGIGLAGRFGGPIGGLVAGVVGALVGGSVRGAEKDALEERQRDYIRKEFKSVSLAKNESTRGFLFFSPPAGTAAFDEATLILDVYEGSANTARLKIPLKGLAYKGRPAAKAKD